MEKALIEDLVELGLNQYEAKAYLALLERDSLAAGEVAKISKIPRARSYDVLDTLVEKGLASLKPGRFKKYCAGDVETFKNRLKVDSKREYHERLDRVEKTALALEQKMELAYPSTERGSDPLQYIEIIREPAMGARRFLEISGKVEFEALHFVKEPFTGDKEELTKQIDLQCQRAKGKHVRARALYEIRDERDEWLYEFIEIAVTRGDEDARILTSLPLKGAVIDERTIIMALHDPIRSKVSFTTMVIEHPDLARVLKITFDTLWNQAENYRTWKRRNEKRR
jgi:sugar-specific transcriptional regulator TrmB